MSIESRLQRLEERAGFVNCPHCGRPVPVPKIDSQPAPPREDSRREAIAAYLAAIQDDPALAGGSGAVA